MTENADRNVCILIHNAKPFEDETDGKEHSESQINSKSWEAIKMIGPWTYLHKYKM